jgi:Cep192 domain 4/HYDIN/CFA65/VesB-like, Ig-like domain/Abnormal spindle-like microcephaly-assoc'd, ASPM-SPD-2-Hydin
MLLKTVRWIGALALPAMIFLLTACGGGGGSGIGSDPPAAATSQVSLSPTSVNFGTVSLGGQRSEDVTLSNTGTADLTVTKASVTGASFTISGLELPLTLPAGQQTNFTAIFKPKSSGAAVGSISVISSAVNSPTSTSLSGTAAQLAIAVSPARLNFGNVAEGADTAQTITVKNAGAASVTITSAAVSGAEFGVRGLSLPVTVPAGQSSSFSATFSPITAGSASGNITLLSNASNSPLAVPLAGTGVAPLLGATPSALNFGSVAVGGRSTLIVNLLNSGSSSIDINRASVTGAGFSVSGLNLPLRLSGGQGVGFSVTLSPAAAGSATGSVSIASNASDPLLVIPLFASAGSFQLVLSPASINFGNVKPGAAGSQSVAIENTGTSSVVINQAKVTGAGFSISGLSLPLALPAGHSAAFTARFSPSTASNASGSVSIVSNASNSPTMLELTGTGTRLTLGASPASLSFGSVAIGKNSTLAVNLTNTGTASLTITQAAVSGSGFSIAGLSLPVTLNPSQSARLDCAFSPTSANNASGSVSVTSNASNSPLAIALSGAGATSGLSASPASVSFGNVGVGNSSSQVVTLTNTGTSSVTVSTAGVTGTGFKISGPALPLTLAAGRNANFTATFAPGSAGNASGSIIVVSSASNSPLAVALAGAGVTLQLSSNPSTLSFGNVTVNQNSSLPVVLTNTGSSTITISQATVNGDGFTIGGLNLPLTLEPKQNTEFNVTFSPTSAGSTNGSVSITSNAVNSPLAMSVSGTGQNVHSVTLSWSASASQNIVGYNVFRSTVRNGPFTQINSSLVTNTSYTDTSLQPGKTYYYVTTAQNSQGTQSPYSNQAQANVPSP